jgi:hypothetical protein
MAAIVKESTDLVVAVAGQGLVLWTLGANYVAAAAEVGRAIHEQVTRYQKKLCILILWAIVSQWLKLSTWTKLMS